MGLSRKARLRRWYARFRTEMQRRSGAAYKAEWLSDPRPTCPWCGLPTDTLAARIDPFHWVYYGETEDEPYPSLMTSCEACWRWRYMET